MGGGGKGFCLGLSIAGRKNEGLKKKKKKERKDIIFRKHSLAIN